MLILKSKNKLNLKSKPINNLQKSKNNRNLNKLMKITIFTLLKNLIVNLNPVNNKNNRMHKNMFLRSIKIKIKIMISIHKQKHKKDNKKNT